MSGIYKWVRSLQSQNCSNFYSVFISNLVQLLKIPGSRLPESSISFPYFSFFFILFLFDLSFSIMKKIRRYLTIEINRKEKRELCRNRTVVDYTFREALINIFLNAKWHRNFLSKIWHFSVFLLRLSSQ